jgi:hypothetical protein
MQEYLPGAENGDTVPWDVIPPSGIHFPFPSSIHMHKFFIRKGKYEQERNEA